MSQYQVSTTHRYFTSTSNHADIFTVSPLSVHDLRVVLNDFLARAQQYGFVKQSASFGGRWTGVMSAANTVYFALSGTLRSIRDCAGMEALSLVDTGGSRCRILSSLVLTFKTFLFAPRMLRYFKVSSDIGCKLDSPSFLPPSSGQLLGVHSVAAEEDRGMCGSSCHFIRSLYSVPVSHVSRLHSFSQTRSINN